MPIHTKPTGTYPTPRGVPPRGPQGAKLAYFRDRAKSGYFAICRIWAFPDRPISGSGQIEPFVGVRRRCGQAEPYAAPGPSWAS